MFSVMYIPLSSGNVPKKGTLAEPSILLILGGSMRILFSFFLELPGELLSGKFRFISIKADGGSSVEMPSSAGSIVSNVSALFSRSLKIIEIQAGYSSCRCPVVFPTSLTCILLHGFFGLKASTLSVISF